MRQGYDVLVLGGGPAGAAAALVLARANLSVAVVDRARSLSPRAGEVLPPSVHRPLVRLGLWDSFLAAGHRPIVGIVSDWGGGPPLENDFLFSPYGSGWLLDRGRFDADLVVAARAAGADVYPSVRIVGCERAGEASWQVRVREDDERSLSGRSLSATWVVDATGRSAGFARRLGSRLTPVDRLVALFGETPPTPIGGMRLVLEACAEGWWYRVVLPSGCATAALMTDADLAPRQPGARARFWTDSLRRTRLMRGLVDDSGPMGRVRVVAARSARLDRAAGRNWLAVGDAALAYDPLSGQGIVRALGSGEAGGRAIVDWYEGDHAAPGRYADAVAEEFKRYQTLCLSYYASERRWSGSPFWERRHGTGRLRVSSAAVLWP